MRLRMRVRKPRTRNIPSTLAETAIKNAKPKEKPYKLTDAHGLHLLITSSGGKLRRFRYRFAGKENTLGLGAYSPNDPEHVSLAKARELCFEARKLIGEGRNPAAERKRPQPPPRPARLMRLASRSKAPQGNGSPHISRT